MRLSAVALAAVVFTFETVAGAVVNAAGPSSPSPSSSPEISLDIDRCPSLPRDEVSRLAALELDARIVVASSEKGRVTQIRIACGGPAVQMTVVDPITGKQLTRTIDLPAQSSAVAARTVALASAELVITSWMELTLTEAGARVPATETSQPSADLRRAAQDRAEQHVSRGQGVVHLLAFAQAAGPFSGMGLAWGGGLRLGWTSARTWIGDSEIDDKIAGHPGLDLELAGTRADVDALLGTIHASTWSAALRATLTLRRGRAGLDLGAGARFGLARLTAVPTDPGSARGGTLAGTWAGPVAYVGLGAQLRHVRLGAGVEAGQVLRRVEGLVDGGAPVSIAGRWFAGTLAIGWGQ